MYFEYNVEKIENLLKDFYLITKIKTVFYDSDFNVIAAVPYEECAFCDAMSKNEETRLKCDYCTKNGLFNCRREGKLVIYHCHAGLVEAIAPIKSSDVILGYIMLGQVLQEDDKENRAEDIICYATEYIGNQAQSCFNELKLKSSAEIQASTKIMESCVCYLLMNNIIAQKQVNTVFEISRYIEENPAADLSVNALCSRFNMSRNSLYRTSNIYFGMTIASYVRNKRLRYAQKLIKEGQLVTIAAEQAGFYDYGYFGKIFKRYIGKTPTQIRKKQ